jgi:hypothetical protein
MDAPEKNPKDIAMKTVPTTSLMSTMHNTTTPEETTKMTLRLKRPRDGAKAPGIIRPRMLEAFNIES